MNPQQRPTAQELVSWAFLTARTSTRLAWVQLAAVCRRRCAWVRGRPRGSLGCSLRRRQWRVAAAALGCARSDPRCNFAEFAQLGISVIAIKPCFFHPRARR